MGVGPTVEVNLPPSSTPPRRRGRWQRLAILGAALVLLYLAVAYLILPAYWTHYARHHPAFDDIPGITHTGDDLPGDPLNVALIGTEAELHKIMLAAGWYPADPLTLRSSLRIAADSVLKRPFDDAPVSNLYLWGRKQDLAFEQPVGDSPRHRHHVRFWRSNKEDPDGRPVWVGSAIYDKRVGLSRRTGQITHMTAPDIDAERDKLFHDLKQTGDLSEVYFVDGFHKTLKGRNGGGDPWYTDGRLEVGVITMVKTP
jgi:LssY C-terminus